MAKCRQALECIVYNLWRKLSNNNEGDVSVVMRLPKLIPDLSSILERVKKKTSRIVGLEELTNNIKEIKKTLIGGFLTKGFIMKRINQNLKE